MHGHGWLAGGRLAKPWSCCDCCCDGQAARLAHSAAPVQLTARPPRPCHRSPSRSCPPPRCPPAGQPARCPAGAAVWGRLAGGQANRMVCAAARRAQATTQQQQLSATVACWSGLTMRSTLSRSLACSRCTPSTMAAAEMRPFSAAARQGAAGRQIGPQGSWHATLSGCHGLTRCTGGANRRAHGQHSSRVRPPTRHRQPVQLLFRDSLHNLRAVEGTSRTACRSTSRDRTG